MDHSRSQCGHPLDDQTGTTEARCVTARADPQTRYLPATDSKAGDAGKSNPTVKTLFSISQALEQGLDIQLVA